MENASLRADIKLHILIADDDIDDIEFFRAAVEDISKQTKVTVASEGFELIAFLKIISPDIIFLDLNMPVMTGIDCLRQMRAVKSYDHIPVIIYSTTLNPAYIEQTYALGASMYFEKPVSYALIKQRLSEIFSNSDKLLPQLPRDKYVVKGSES